MLGNACANPQLQFKIFTHISYICLLYQISHIEILTHTYMFALPDISCRNTNTHTYRFALPHISYRNTKTHAF